MSPFGSSAAPGGAASSPQSAPFVCVCVCELCDTPRDWPSVFVDRMDQNVTITFIFLYSSFLFYFLILHLITHPFAKLLKNNFQIVDMF